MEALQDRHQRMIQVIQAAAEIATRIANSTKIGVKTSHQDTSYKAGELEGGE